MLRAWENNGLPRPRPALAATASWACCVEIFGIGYVLLVKQGAALSQADVVGEERPARSDCKDGDGDCKLCRELSLVKLSAPDSVSRIGSTSPATPNMHSNALSPRFNTSNKCDFIVGS